MNPQPVVAAIGELLYMTAGAYALAVIFNCLTQLVRLLSIGGR